MNITFSSPYEHYSIESIFEKYLNNYKIFFTVENRWCLSDFSCWIKAEEIYKLENSSKK